MIALVRANDVCHINNKTPALAGTSKQKWLKTSASIGHSRFETHMEAATKYGENNKLKNSTSSRRRRSNLFQHLQGEIWLPPARERGRLISTLTVAAS
jgi:hypothetical protein